MITGWERIEQLRAAAADQARRYAHRIGAETITVGGPEDGVTVVIGVDGFLVDVRIDALARRRRTPAALATLSIALVREAEQAARRRRARIREEP